MVDENEIPATYAVLIAAADMSVKYEGSFTGQGVFTINYQFFCIIMSIKEEEEYAPRTAHLG